VFPFPAAREDFGSDFAGLSVIRDYAAKIEIAVGRRPQDIDCRALVHP
jgi:hypothetical protein